MKQASRFMPKYEPKKASKPVVFAFFAIAVAIVIYQPWYLLVIAGIALVVIVWSAIDQPNVERHFQNLCKERSGSSICEFAREFDSKVVDTWIIRAVYEQLQAALPTKQSVPIKASDGLFDTLMLDEDDLDLELIEEIAQRTGRSVEGYESNPYYGKVTTAGNLVLFFNHQARANAT
ncbi:hypothetical protein [Simiduia agarivorans]|uniref:Uncharacterized protein n=1 Tax=Simiduia agarivorans (strain DSM 21679 / JCM 13881 / BCRC 17597 / SA1) TaxID=1117647 RepID=K4KPP4_SIMAS|nr:hypothetical protein [Simiduia agarivorans]AFV00104.1 hypothetical protein M5M_14845 [Simiduia agarivorans SA1 = DSM 21679]